MRPALPNAHLARGQPPEILEGKRPQQQGGTDPPGQKGRQGFGLPSQSLVFAADYAHRKGLLTFLNFCATAPNDAAFDPKAITVRKYKRRF
ncbi:MAG TPA: hypothetical protein VK479_15215, partial [Micropepsaceae bacterium]|nr:hypothetical protein [Micropepsaceae bacterium]